MGFEIIFIFMFMSITDSKKEALKAKPNRRLKFTRYPVPNSTSAIPALRRRRGARDRADVLFHLLSGSANTVRRSGSTGTRLYISSREHDHRSGY
jgi:hypothetical protein